MVFGCVMKGEATCLLLDCLSICSGHSVVPLSLSLAQPGSRRPHLLNRLPCFLCIASHCLSMFRSSLQGQSSGLQASPSFWVLHELHFVRTIGCLVRFILFTCCCSIIACFVFGLLCFWYTITTIHLRNWYIHL